MSCHLIYTFLKRVYVKLFSKPFSELNITFRTRVIKVQFKMTTSVMLLLPRGLLMCACIGTVAWLHAWRVIISNVCNKWFMVILHILECKVSYLTDESKQVIHIKSS